MTNPQNNTPDELKRHFEANMLDGDKVQGGQMLSSEFVLEYLTDYCVLRTEVNQKCLEARLIELDLLEQALNDGRDLKAYKLQRLENLTQRLQSQQKGQDNG
jgi:hypothetical protein